MKSLSIKTYNISFLTKVLDKFQKNKSTRTEFITWLFIWYFGSSILLLLSLHSYYMGFGK